MSANDPKRTFADGSKMPCGLRAQRSESAFEPEDAFPVILHADHGPAALLRRKSSGGGLLTPKCTGHEDGRAWRQSGSRGTSRGRARRLGNAISVLTARRLARDQADPRGGKSRAAMRIFLSCSK